MGRRIQESREGWRKRLRSCSRWYIKRVRYPLAGPSHLDCFSEPIRLEPLSFIHCPEDHWGVGAATIALASAAVCIGNPFLPFFDSFWVILLIRFGVAGSLPYVVLALCSIWLAVFPCKLHAQAWLFSHQPWSCVLTNVIPSHQRNPYLISFVHKKKEDLFQTCPFFNNVFLGHPSIRNGIHGDSLKKRL